jgi:hypothetical protein
MPPDNVSTGHGGRTGESRIDKRTPFAAVTGGTVAARRSLPTMRPDELERRLRERLDVLGQAPRAELLHVLMLPDLDRAGRIGEFRSYPQSHLRRVADRLRGRSGVPGGTRRDAAEVRPLDHLGTGGTASQHRTGSRSCEGSTDRLAISADQRPRQKEWPFGRDGDCPDQPITL